MKEVPMSLPYGGLHCIIELQPPSCNRDRSILAYQSLVTLVEGVDQNSEMRSSHYSLPQCNYIAASKNNYSEDVTEPVARERSRHSGHVIQKRSQCPHTGSREPFAVPVALRPLHTFRYSDEKSAMAACCHKI